MAAARGGTGGTPGPGAREIAGTYDTSQVTPAVSRSLAMVGCIADFNDSDEYSFYSDPAPLEGQIDADAPGYFVVFEDHIDATEEAGRLAAEYPIEVRSVYQAVFSGIFALMSQRTMERVRCVGQSVGIAVGRGPQRGRRASRSARVSVVSG